MKKIWSIVISVLILLVIGSTAITVLCVADSQDNSKTPTSITENVLVNQYNCVADSQSNSKTPMSIEDVTVGHYKDVTKGTNVGRNAGDGAGPNTNV